MVSTGQDWYDKLESYPALLESFAYTMLDWKSSPKKEVIKFLGKQFTVHPSNLKKITDRDMKEVRQLFSSLAQLGWSQRSDEIQGLIYSTLVKAISKGYAKMMSADEIENKEVYLFLSTNNYPILFDSVVSRLQYWAFGERIYINWYKKLEHQCTLDT